MKNVADIYPLSPAQLGMLFHTLSNPQSGVYINQYTGEIQGNLQPNLFRQAWQQTINRHPVLRTVFLWEGLDDPLQVVRQQVDLPWQELDWQQASPATQAQQLNDFLQADRHQGFDLAQAPLLRFTIIHLSEHNYRFIWSSHHLLFDGWSLPLIWQDMLAYYAALKQDQPAQIGRLRPYRDYIAWQQAQTHPHKEAFWRAQLQEFSEPTPLPAARTVPQATGERYQQQTKLINSSLTTNLATIARQNRLTLNTIIQGLWAVLLHHYSGNDKIIYGSVMSGRPAELADVETMVGLFINTVPVCISIEPEQTVIDWLQDRQQQLLTLRQYESTPLTEIQHWSNLPIGRSLFESIVVFENYPTAIAPDMGFTTHNVQYLEQSNYPLALLVLPGASLEFILLYDPGKFADGAVKNLLNHLEQLVQAIITAPQSRLNQLPNINPTLQQTHTNGPALHYPRDRGIHQLIEAQVNQTPEAIAVKFADMTLTYAELNQRANQLAYYLRSQGIATGSRVAICLPRSTEMIVSIVAVLKAGAAYVPLDPSYPAARLEYCFADTAPQICLTQQSIKIATGDTSRVDLDDPNRSFQNCPSSNLEHISSSNNLAYIIYTSGSTGKPKGVMVSHQNLIHSTMARFHVYAEPVGRFLLLSSIAFDSSVAGIFWTLCQGGTLVIAPERIEQDLQQLTQLISQAKITHTLCVPTLYNLLIDAAVPHQLRTLKTVIVAGEACSRNLVKQHYTQLAQTQLYNEYGPTEATVWCTAAQIPHEPSAGPITIGKPIPNTQIQILDEAQRPVPIGAIGEIYISGDGVTNGYLNQPERTAATFHRQAAPASRLYKTGDRGRYRADGNLEWLGRNDRQVKIRGYRIELGEVEDALLQQPNIQEAVVINKSVMPLAESVEQLVTALGTLSDPQAEHLLTLAESDQQPGKSPPLSLE
ncbi:amino acid adenylation domain-containing protein [filamentous cyanobacterium LEGE 11480]|uniref:Amino acid adenylation domain-containing protein n=1 Tax=Romeriopsis navalis LEGE 11480 TaxID=2777977 RepID=A0A928Z303_9CYAN|nr:amino acid adenylation domain-containing protein [Romeriopsis navalis]MBE9028850.1 amino acid adenylation domain-containing protein [Romeriopsis navalis LEGE 11480]